MTERAQPGLPKRLALGTAVLAIVFVVVGIGTPLLGLRVFAASDLMMLRAPWTSLVPTGFIPQNPWVTDTVDGVIPATHAFVERLKDGDFALWGPDNAGGAELGSVPDNAVLSPMSLPYYVLPISLAPAYTKLLELAVSLGGMYLFLRRVRLERAAAILGGLVFVGSGFMVAWTNWPHTRVAALIPAVFWVLERIVSRRRPLDVALLAVVVATMLLGGFPAVTAIALFAGAIYLVVRLLVEHRTTPRRIVVGGVAAAAGVALGLAVAAFQIVPFVVELGQVVTANRSQSPGSHSVFPSLTLMVAPDVFGSTNRTVGAVRWFGPTNPVEEMAYVGVTAMVLALIGAVAWRRGSTPPLVRGYFVVAAVLTAELIFLGGPILGAMQQLPVFATNPIGRARSMLGFFAAVLAAIGFDALIRGPVQVAVSTARRRLWWLAATAAWVGTGVALAAAAFLAWRHAGNAGHRETFYAALVVPLAIGVVTLVLVTLARVSCRDALRAVALGALPVLVVIQSLMVVLPYWPRVPPEQFYPVTSTHTFLQDHLGGERVVTFGTMLTGSEGYYGIRTVGGRGFVDKDYARLVQTGCPTCFRSPTYVSPPKDPDGFDPDVLDRLAAKYAVIDPNDPVIGVAERVGTGGSVVEVAPDEPIRIDLPPGGLRAIGYTLIDLVEPTDPFAAIELVVENADGEALFEARRRLFDGPPPRNMLAAVPEDAVAGAVAVEVTLRSDQPVQVTGAGGTPQLTVIRPADDGYKIVDVGPATVYQRLNALPRIRWADSAVVEPDIPTALNLVASGDAPGVVLAAPGPPPSGGSATVDVTEDSGDAIEVEVDADGDGYLVVADALNDRWTVTVDGVAADLRIADVGYVAVAVPAGLHEVRLEYRVTADGAGYVMSGGAALVLLGLVVADRRRTRRPGGGEP